MELILSLVILFPDPRSLLGPIGNFVVLELKFKHQLIIFHFIDFWKFIDEHLVELPAFLNFLLNCILIIFERNQFLKFPIYSLSVDLINCSFLLFFLSDFIGVLTFVWVSLKNLEFEKLFKTHTFLRVNH